MGIAGKPSGQFERGSCM